MRITFNNRKGKDAKSETDASETSRTANFLSLDQINVWLVHNTTKIQRVPI